MERKISKTIAAASLVYAGLPKTRNLFTIFNNNRLNSLPAKFFYVQKSRETIKIIHNSQLKKKLVFCMTTCIRMSSAFKQNQVW